MAWQEVVYRVLNKAGTSFIEPATADKQPNVVGTFGYKAGSSGTVVLTGGKRILHISALSLEGAASFTINGGDVIELPYGSTDKVSTEIEINPKGNLVDPTFVFTGTTRYFIEWAV